MKKYIAYWSIGIDMKDCEIFSAKNIKEANRFAQSYKKRNNIIGITIVKRIK